MTHPAAAPAVAPATRSEAPDRRWALVLSDGKPGHENQSLGILPEALAPWRFVVRYPSRGAFLRACGAARVPCLSRLLIGPFPWRGIVADADALAARLAADPPAVVVSAGSGPAPMNLLVARHLDVPAVTCMSPSVGRAPFDLCCVPRHDRARPGPRVVTTLGAPNRLDPEALAAAGAAFGACHGLGEGPFIAVLLGGDTPRLTLPPERARAILGACRNVAERRGAKLLVTTSRRTSPETEAAVAAGAADAAYLCLAGRDPESPVAGMLALADLAVVTEDSVSMVSESASSPARVLTVAVRRKGLGPPRRHGEALRVLAEAGYVVRTDAAHLEQDAGRLLDAPPPPALDESRRCREAVAGLVGP